MEDAPAPPARRAHPPRFEEPHAHTQGSDAVARIFAALYFACLILTAAPGPHAYRFAALAILSGFLALAFALRRLTKEDVTA
ncbi:hypothetical protein [Deinococcus aquaticus]|uniref:Sensor histidine kinase n=1 Tax=Deinococcus aquaticus TaxID=328692 RepID=A0ABY7UY83_9DEIO|nr:hypothetical protein [Deinococcus aquaticus]WDA57867.1 hypothetical protein M8445_10950 [Deinococcus aquaticus]